MQNIIRVDFFVNAVLQEEFSIDLLKKIIYRISLLGGFFYEEKTKDWSAEKMFQYVTDSLFKLKKKSDLIYFNYKGCDIRVFLLINDKGLLEVSVAPNHEYPETYWTTFFLEPRYKCDYIEYDFPQYTRLLLKIVEPFKVKSIALDLLTDYFEEELKKIHDNESLFMIASDYFYELIIENDPLLYEALINAGKNKNIHYSSIDNLKNRVKPSLKANYEGFSMMINFLSFEKDITRVFFLPLPPYRTQKYGSGLGLDLQWYFDFALLILQKSDIGLMVTYDGVWEKIDKEINSPQ